MHDSMHKGGVNNWTAADCAGWTLANGGFGDLLATPGGAGRSDSPAGDSVGPFGGLGDQADQGRPFSQVLPQRIKSWSLTSLQHRLMKTGGRLVKHARYYWLLLAEGHLNRKLFGEMLGRIWALPVPGG